MTYPKVRPGTRSSACAWYQRTATLVRQNFPRTFTVLIALLLLLHWATDAVLTEFMTAFWTPVGAAFRQGDKELALRTSIEFFVGADVLDELPAEVRQTVEENLAGWEAFTTSPDCFPMLDKERVARLPMPILSLTAANTLPIHQQVNAELARLLPQATQVNIPDASHEMWAEQPDACGEAVLAFLQAQV